MKKRSKIVEKTGCVTVPAVVLFAMIGLEVVSFAVLLAQKGWKVVMIGLRVVGISAKVAIGQDLVVIMMFEVAI